VSTSRGVGTNPNSQAKPKGLFVWAIFGTICSAVLIFLLWVALRQNHVGEDHVALATGLGHHHHPISTQSADAQRFFDQGLTYVYSFNFEEAVRSFTRAAELDPHSPMPHWGIALALGPNFNEEIDPVGEEAAYQAVQRAVLLAPQAPEPEQRYVSALARRYSIAPEADLKKLAIDYKNAMGELTRRYPDDLDAATLYADSLMNLHAWQSVGEIIAVLESVLRRDPDHIGALHYHVHAFEASPHPEQALASAEKLKNLAPAAGHLLHMPSHIYIQTGDYEEAARQNELAVAVDEAYINSRRPRGNYPYHYYCHNLQALAVAHAMQGRLKDSMAAAGRLAEFITPHLKQVPMREFYVPTPILVLVRFRAWDDVLKYAKPSEEMYVTKPLWHFARGLAHAAAGKTTEAETEQDLFRITREDFWGRYGKQSPFLEVAGDLLAAKIAWAQRNRKLAVTSLKTAVSKEDNLNYHEPPVWYLHVRESLGAALLLNGEAAEAEKVFRQELEKYPRNGRALFGLLESLKAQKKDYAARLVEPRYQAAWKNADTQLHIEDF
jgi:tetratricopeptide (TPR) repeat protein